MSKILSVLLLFSVFSLFMAVTTHPNLGNNGAIWMVVPVMVFCPYGIAKAFFEWKKKSDDKKC